jgi:hypothetical protein
MKKYVNVEHEVFIEARITAVDSNKKDGEIVPHRQSVEGITFFNHTETGWQRVYMSRNEIMDIAKQIEEIEAKIIDAEKDELPF